MTSRDRARAAKIKSDTIAGILATYDGPEWPQPGKPLAGYVHVQNVGRVAVPALRDELRFRASAHYDAGLIDRGERDRLLAVVAR